MTTTRVFQSTDTSAPVLTGQVGSLAALLEACLVGVGGVAYGSGGTAKTAAGWTLAFTATNKRAFRNSVAAGGTGHYFRIDDTGGTAAGAREAVLKGYVSMSDVDTGVGSDIMPDATLYPSGGWILKSDTATSTARAWRIIADEISCHLWVSADGGFSQGFHSFGDLASEVPGDNYRSYVLYQASVWSSGSNASRVATGAAETLLSPTTTAQSRGLSIMRAHAGVSAGSVQAGLPVFGRGSVNPLSGASGGAGAPCTSATSPGSGERYFTPLLVCAEGMIRGRLRGVYSCLNDLRSVASGTLQSSASGLPAGSQLMLLQACSSGAGNNSNVGTIAVETALAW
ncbi:hypothetical protein [Tahibacter harae]|uniref:Uncharacterized protein n=1 Tax=Tahibacter harae TaxID=2963937 RepID=A0ABT1QS82_9GAMM|nr:hypothetical protein [Tahibacter harae]MCQ4165145.1 hypothetical protein [Tahibacter harae]